MSFRSYLAQMQNTDRLMTIDKPISKKLEIAGVLKQLEPQPVYFQNVIESENSVTGNLFCSKSDFARYFNITIPELIPFLAAAASLPRKCEEATTAPCQEVIEPSPDLDTLPLLFHCEKDGGNYISSGVVVARHPVYGQNLDFHRCMQISKTEMAVRIVRARHFDKYLNDLGQVDVAICVGVSPNILAAAATSVDLGMNELEIANAMEKVDLVHACSVDLWVPSESEFVIEGTIYANRRHAEGPFVDLTETYDVIRQEPVLEVKCITHRKDAIWHALLPGALEHKLLMGMPREPTIFKKVNEVVRCLDVNVNPGGCSWLHAIVQIDKKNEEDGKLAIEAAFAGHTSCKHIFIVDQDIDIYDPQAVEWAMATRFQGDVDMIIKPREHGSSLDPSSEPGSHLTTKIGFDLTKPLKTAGKEFNKAAFPKIDIYKFLS